MIPEYMNPAGTVILLRDETTVGSNDTVVVEGTSLFDEIMNGVYGDITPFQDHIEKLSIGHKYDEIKQDFLEFINSGYRCSNGITMDSNEEDIRRLDDGCVIADRNAQTVMDIRDFYNTVHYGVSVSEVKTMVNELALFYQQQLKRKWQLQEELENIINDTSLTEGEKIVRIEAVAW